MKALFLTGLIVFMLGAGARTADAQTTNDNRGSLSEKDFKFVKAADEGGKMEVTLGQVAMQNAQDPSVRDFGSRMVRDHQAADQQLEQIIAQKGASVADEPGMWDEHVIKHLQNLQGSDFDKSYIKRMVSEHKKDIKEFQKEADDGEDGDVKNFASKTLPTLQEHLRLAQEAEAKITASASK